MRWRKLLSTCSASVISLAAAGTCVASLSPAASAAPTQLTAQPAAASQLLSAPPTNPLRLAEDMDRSHQAGLLVMGVRSMMAADPEVDAAPTVPTLLMSHADDETINNADTMALGAAWQQMGADVTINESPSEPLVAALQAGNEYMVFRNDALTVDWFNHSLREEDR